MLLIVCDSGTLKAHGISHEVANVLVNMTMQSIHPLTLRHLFRSQNLNHWVLLLSFNILIIFGGRRRLRIHVDDSVGVPLHGTRSRSALYFFLFLSWDFEQFLQIAFVIIFVLVFCWGEELTLNDLDHIIESNWATGAATTSALRCATLARDGVANAILPSPWHRRLIPRRCRSRRHLFSGRMPAGGASFGLIGIHHWSWRGRGDLMAAAWSSWGDASRVLQNNFTTLCLALLPMQPLLRTGILRLVLLNFLFLIFEVFVEVFLAGGVGDLVRASPGGLLSRLHTFPKLF